MRKTKILCTLGPASDSPQMIRNLLHAGMSAVRINFSHGEPDRHAATIREVRQAAAERDLLVPIVADLQGPKIRTGKLQDGRPLELKEGESLRLVAKPVVGRGDTISIDYPFLAHDVKPGDDVLLADGTIKLRVDRVDGDDVICEIGNHGELGERKGVNVPGAKLRLPSVTAKDKKDLKFALAQGVEYVALSFVRSADDVRLLKDLIAAEGADTHVIAKLEKPQALDHLTEILETTDCVMVARGDLGVELSPWKVPVAQKQIIREAARLRKPVVTATQMLESMMHNPSPTRAEASDVANAVFDGTDAVMLSGETAVGEYPLHAVRMMANIIDAAEGQIPAQADPEKDLHLADLSDAMAFAAARLSEERSAKYIVVYTESGYSARLVSKHRPNCSILGLSRHPHVRQRMNLLWGVDAKEIKPVTQVDELAQCADTLLCSLGLTQPGDLICLVAGTPFQMAGKTDLIKFHEIREPTHSLPTTAP